PAARNRATFTMTARTFARTDAMCEPTEPIFATTGATAMRTSATLTMTGGSSPGPTPGTASIASDRRHCGTTFAATARIATPIIAISDTTNVMRAPTVAIFATIDVTSGTMFAMLAAAATQKESERLGDITTILRRPKRPAPREPAFSFCWARDPTNRGRSEIYVAFENAHGRAADARHELSFFIGNLDVNFAGTPHLNALRYREMLAGFQLVVAHQICAEGAARGACRRILDDFPWQHAARKSLPASAKREAISHRAVAIERVKQRAHVHVDALQRCLASQRNHQIKNSGDTDSIGKLESMSLARKPSASASVSRENFGVLKRASFCVIVTRTGLPPRNVISTGSIPAP